ncbi:hypothetical protein PtA15_6A676 [Puccinia triticina]|uniref:Uncharacterized protein n=1 Tax=Puccinia triticina TaxID=208348 RepID=A0ABY7CLD1_9BASI|nr:uncharacterized protein PtA15_6A676 [Puccinia triticina]WAQ86046.1 hypothetical protein PtA15_6A676 [Puccinia triticina]
MTTWPWRTFIRSEPTPPRLTTSTKQRFLLHHAHSPYSARLGLISPANTNPVVQGEPASLTTLYINARQFNSPRRVNHVSVTNGHQLGKIKPADAVAGNNGAGEIKKKLATPETPSGSRASPITPSFSARKPAPAAKLLPNLTPTKGKQKAQDVLDDEEEAMFDKEEADASEPEPEPAPAAPEPTYLHDVTYHSTSFIFLGLQQDHTS